MTGPLARISSAWRGVTPAQEAALGMAGRRSKLIDARCPEAPATQDPSGGVAAGKDGTMAVKEGTLTGLDRLARFAEVAESERGGELSATNAYAALKGSLDEYKGLAAVDIAAALDAVRQQAVDENAAVCDAAGVSIGEAAVLGELCGLLSRVSEAAEAHMDDAYVCVSAVGGDRGVQPPARALALALAPTIRAAVAERDAIAAKAVGAPATGAGDGATEAPQAAEGGAFWGEPPVAVDADAAEAAGFTFVTNDGAEAPAADVPDAAEDGSAADDTEEEMDEQEPEPARVAPAREKSQDMAGLLADVLSHAEDAIGLDVELTVAQYAEVYGIGEDAESIRRHLGSRIAAYCKLGKF